MTFKFADEVIDEIKTRGHVEIPEGSVSGEEFEEWLHLKNKTVNGHTLVLEPGAIIMPGDKFC